MKFLSDILAKAGLIVDGTVTLNSVANATTDPDKFLVVDSGVVKYRTGVQLLEDIGGGGTGSTFRFIETFVATSGQTAFTTVNTLTSQYFDVYLNGVRLNTSSYSSTSNTITLVDGAYTGDIIDVVILATLSLAAPLPSQSGNAGKYLSTDGTNTSWEPISTSSLTAAFATDYDYNITGARNSSNKVFTLSQNYVSGSTRVYLNGIRYTPGGGYDYTETGVNEITFINAPDSGDLITVDYIKS